MRTFHCRTHAVSSARLGGYRSETLCGECFNLHQLEDFCVFVYCSRMVMLFWYFAQMLYIRLGLMGVIAHHSVNGTTLAMPVLNYQQKYTTFRTSYC